MKFLKSPLFSFALLLLFFVSCENNDMPEDDINTSIGVTSLKINSETLSILMNNTLQLSVIISPSDASDKTLLWSSSNADIASVDSNGLVKGLIVGSVEISVKSVANPSIVNSISLEITGSTSNSITEFFLSGKEAILIADHTLGLQLPYGTDLTTLQPTLVHNGSTISPSPDLEQNFSEPVTYTITSDTGEIQEWIVKIITITEVPISEGFITTWVTTNSGLSDDNSIEIPIYPGLSYNYRVRWGDGSMDENVSGNIKHTYEIPGTYYVRVIGDFPRIKFDSLPWENNNDRQKIITINQWGNINWSGFDSAFRGCSQLDVEAIDTPDLSNVYSVNSMFRFCSKLKGNASFENWNVSSLTNMSFLFGDAMLFNQDISNWNVSNVKYFIDTFDGAITFNQPIGSWDVSNAIQINGIFSRATSFNQDISSWDVSNVLEIGSAFSDATSFNQDISSWDVSNCSYFAGMFYNATSFNQNIGNWNVAKGDNMSAMFAGATAFNQDISGWNISNTTDINSMFFGADSFNQDISVWDVSKVTDMTGVFSRAISFNQDLSNWNVSNVTNMELMFRGAIAFDQNIGSWDIGKVSNMSGMFLEVSLSRENYDGLLNGWNNLVSVQNGLSFSGGNSQYCLSEIARQNLIDTYGWIITDGGKDCN